MIRCWGCGDEIVPPSDHSRCVIERLDTELMEARDCLRLAMKGLGAVGGPDWVRCKRALEGRQ